MKLVPILLSSILLMVLLLAGFGAMAEPTVSDHEKMVFLTSAHSAGLIFYTDVIRNDSVSFNSNFRIYNNFTVTIVGADQPYVIELVDRNLTYRGNTTSNITKLTFAVNGTAIWIIVTLGEGNGTIYNFGISGISKEAADIVIHEPAPTVTVSELLRREWRAIWMGAVLIGSLVLMAFVGVRSYKQHHILRFIR